VAAEQIASAGSSCRTAERADPDDANWEKLRELWNGN